MKILRIDSSIQGENSVSRQISAEAIAKFEAAYDGATVQHRDLVADPLPHLHPQLFAANLGMTSDHEPALQAEFETSQAVLQEFIDADIVVIGAGMYNYSIPSQLKAWIDRIILFNKTFRYTAEGTAEGLMGGKRVILCISRGGLYEDGTPGADVEHCERYLSDILSFIGITDLTAVTAGGVAIGDEQREQAIASAKAEIAELPV